jgi:ring-1,2-phenylacetyl-CoA epoxidase subunit PaaD
MRSTAAEARAWAVASSVPDPELPVVTLADLGILRGVEVTHGGAGVLVTITPTYSGCPAIATIRGDLHNRLSQAGFTPVDVRTRLSPAWSTDHITAEGRRKLAAHGIAPPGPARLPSGPVPLDLGPARRAADCPLCGSPDTVQTSEFGSTACKALRVCRSCREPFEHIKEI